jgi:hypothetical protein
VKPASPGGRYAALSGNMVNIAVATLRPFGVNIYRCASFSGGFNLFLTLYAETGY